MDPKLVFFSSYETILSLVFGLLTIFITYQILKVTIFRYDPDTQLKERNVAVGIVGGAIIFCVLLLVQTSIRPSVDSLRLLVSGGEGDITAHLVFLSLGYFILFYIIATIISVVVVMLSIAIYMLATTKIEELKEIKENNIAIAILVSLIIAGMTLFIRPSVNNFITSLVNHNVTNEMNKDYDADALEKENKVVPPKKMIEPKAMHLQEN